MRIKVAPGPHGPRWYTTDHRFEEKERLLAAGFTYAARKAPHYWSDDPRAVDRLRPHCDGAAVAMLDQQLTLEQRRYEMSRSQSSALSVPTRSGKTPYGYQLAFVAFAQDCFARNVGVLCGDEMGVGKTVETLLLVNADPSIKSVVITCPKIAMLVWFYEIREWVTRPMSIRLVGGRTPLVPGAAHIQILNHDILWKHRATLRAAAWDLAVNDEAHKLKNGAAKRTIALYGGFLRARKDAKTGLMLPAERLAPVVAARRVALTGTPMPNRPAELYPTVKWLDPTGWPNKSGFHARYCQAQKIEIRVRGGGKRHVWDTRGASNVKELNEKLRSRVMIRRLKRDVLTDLPPKRRQVIELPQDSAATARIVAAEKAAYERHRSRLRQLKLVAERARAVDNVAEYRAAVDALREALSVSFTEMSRIRHEIALAKLPAVLEHSDDLLDSVSPRKLVVFAWHRDVIQAIQKHYGRACVSIMGGVPNDVRRGAEQSFLHDAKTEVAAAQILAAGVAINLTSSADVSFAEGDWVPANILQCEDRCHRATELCRGHDRINIRHLVFNGSLEANVYKKMIAKQELADATLDADLRDAILAAPILPDDEDDTSLLDVGTYQTAELLAPDPDEDEAHPSPAPRGPLRSALFED